MVDSYIGAEMCLGHRVPLPCSQLTYTFSEVTIGV